MGGQRGDDGVGTFGREASRRERLRRPCRRDVDVAAAPGPRWSSSRTRGAGPTYSPRMGQGHAATIFRELSAGSTVSLTSSGSFRNGSTSASRRVPFRCRPSGAPRSSVASRKPAPSRSPTVQGHLTATGAIAIPPLVHLVAHAHPRAQQVERNLHVLEPRQDRRPSCDPQAGIEDQHLTGERQEREHHEAKEDGLGARWSAGDEGDQQGDRDNDLQQGAKGPSTGDMEDDGPRARSGRLISVVRIHVRRLPNEGITGRPTCASSASGFRRARPPAPAARRCRRRCSSRSGPSGPPRRRPVN